MSQGRGVYLVRLPKRILERGGGWQAAWSNRDVWRGTARKPCLQKDAGKSCRMDVQHTARSTWRWWRHFCRRRRLDRNGPFGLGTYGRTAGGGTFAVPCRRNCTALRCAALRCAVLCCAVLWSLHCSALFDRCDLCSALLCSALFCSALLAALLVALLAVLF